MSLSEVYAVLFLSKEEPRFMYCFTQRKLLFGIQESTNFVCVLYKKNIKMGKHGVLGVLCFIMYLVHNIMPI